MIGRFNGRRRNGAQALIPSIEEVMPRLTHEMNRARRYHRPLTFAFIRPGRGKAVSVRAIDVTARIAPDGQIVALPETTREGAEGFLQRVAPQLASVDDCTIATFPEDAVTLAGVLERLLDGNSTGLATAPPSRTNGTAPNGERRAEASVSPTTSNGSRY